MKILISSLIDLQKSSHNSRLHQFIKHLSREHEITVISLNDWWKAKWDEKSSDYRDDFKELLNDIEYIYLTEKKISPVLQDISTLVRPNLIKDVLRENEYDIHFSYNCLSCGYVIGKYLNSRAVNTIYDIADDLPEMAKTSPQIPSFLRPFSGIVSKAIFKRNVQLAKKITCTTKSLVNSYRIPDNKSVLIPNGVDTELFRKYPSDRLKRQLGIDNCFVIGHIGVLREWLDFEPLFKAFKSISASLNVKLLIVGDGIGYDETVRMAEKYDISKNIVFTGTVPYSKVPYYISCMDVGVIPFKLDNVSQNSLPLKLFEYMACEKPVISTNVRGIIENFQNNVLYASSYEDYLSRIKDLYMNDDFRNSLGKSGRELIALKFDWTRIAAKLQNVFEETRIHS